ncbi:hypothetical protein Vi05172_g2880 [Venturia inaequalis]|nr:hypothetical protein Vi05172_g2880 [Venturia inaequalis]
MAAQEYFSSFNQGPQQGPPYPTTTVAPQYTPSPYQQLPQQQQQPYGTPPVHQQQPYAAPPQPWDPRQGYAFPPPDVYNQGYPPQRPNPATSQSTLMPPLQPYRSRSEPPEKRRVTLVVPHKHHHRHRSDSRSRSRSRPRSSRSGHSHHSHRSDSRSSGRSGTRSHSRARNDRDTFFGAGGGAIIGDTLVPGLGTLGGALLGALGGNKYAKRRPKSDVSGSDHERRKYKDGITVHSRWGSDR